MFLLNLWKKEQESKNVVRNIEQNTKHAGCATQVELRVDKKAYTHDTDS